MHFHTLGLLPSQIHPLRQPSQFDTNKPDGLANRNNEPKPSPVRFGFSLNRLIPFSEVQIVADFNDQTSTARIRNEIRDVAQFVSANKDDLPSQLAWMKFRKSVPAGATNQIDFSVISDIPAGNEAYQARSVAELGFRPTKHRDLFVHVTDRGVGNGEDRSILVTQHHGVYIGPNNQSLSLLIKLLEANRETYELHPIDFKKVQALKQYQYNDPGYRIAATFHGRDVFAVVAGALIAGVEPEAFADKTRKLTPQIKGSFAEEFPTLDPAQTNRGLITVQALRDRTYDNIVTNARLSPELQAQLANPFNLERLPVIKITNPETGESFTAPLRSYFSQVPAGQPLVYPGSTLSAHKGGNTGLVEIAINEGAAAERLGLSRTHSQPLQIQFVASA